MARAYIRGGHACLDCGGWVGTTLRCKPCNLEWRKRTGAICLGCGKPLSRSRSKRCRECFRKLGAKVRPPLVRAPQTLEEIEARLWRRHTVQDGDCRLWLGADPLFKVWGKSVSARRWIYEQRFGPLPRRFFPRATCGRCQCIEPSHQEVVPFSQLRLEEHARKRARL